jgi:predicted PurR-regulated permease PerM
MANWFAQHEALAVVGLVAAVFLVGWAEYRVMREKTLARSTLIFGLLILCVYIGGSQQFGLYGIGTGVVLFVVGATAIVRLTRDPRRR